jgi:hypothetical protein
MISEEKIFHLLGRRNMGQVKLELEARKYETKRVGMALLGELSNASYIKLSYDPRRILAEYYRTRAKRDDITGLSYAGIIRIFKTSDVISEFKAQSMGLVDEIITSLESTLYTHRHLHHAKVVRDYQAKWLEENDLLSIITEELPPGFGPDDARIAKKLLRLEKENPDPFSFVIVTEDRAMIEAITAISSHATVIRYPRDRYLTDCLNSSRTGLNVRHFDGKKTIKSRFLTNVVPYGQRYIVVYDFPNIERAVESYGMLPTGYFKLTGGYLKRSTLRSTVGWSETPWSQLIRLEDFQTGTRPLSLRSYPKA